MAEVERGEPVVRSVVPTGPLYDELSAINGRAFAPVVGQGRFKSPEEMKPLLPLLAQGKPKGSVSLIDQFLLAKASRTEDEWVSRAIAYALDEARNPACQSPDAMISEQSLAAAAEPAPATDLASVEPGSIFVSAIRDIARGS